jgi:hypothetical protein
VIDVNGALGCNSLWSLSVGDGCTGLTHIMMLFFPRSALISLFDVLQLWSLFMTYEI